MSTPQDKAKHKLRLLDFMRPARYVLDNYEAPHRVAMFERQGQMQIETIKLAKRLRAMVEG